jgi:YbbR domain-containing protein
VKDILARIWEAIKSIFTKNWGMKLGALLFAFLLWSFVISDTNPPREKIFRDIPISYTNAEELKDKMLTPSIPFSDVLRTATVTVREEASQLQYISESMITVYVDVSPIIDVGEYTLSLQATTMMGDVVSIQPETVTLEVEELVTRDVPVEVQYIGDKKDDLYYGDPILSENTVKVTGSRSNLETVAKGICYIDINAMEESSKESRQVSLYDEDGNEIPSSLFSGIPSVIVEVPIYHKKEVPVDLENIRSTLTGVAEGYEVKDIVLTPAAVEVVGAPGDLEEIESVTITPIALDNASADVVVTGSIVLPEHIYLTVPPEIQVQITIAQPEITQTYDAMDVTVKNLGNGLRASLSPESIDVMLTGPQTVVEAITADQLLPFVDLEGLSEGTHTVSVKYENLPDLEVEITSPTEYITVTIT